MASQLGARATSQSGGAPPLQTRRKNDRSDLIIFKEVNHAPMMTKLVASGQKKVTGDPKYYMFEQDYETFEFELGGSDAAGAAATLGTTTTLIRITNIGDILQPGDLIHVPAGDDDQSTAEGTVKAAGEVMIFEEVLGTNHGEVTRGGGAGSATSNVATSVAANTIKSQMASNINAEGATSRTALSGQLEEDYNYTAIFRSSWEVTGTLDATDLYGGDEQMIEARQKRRSFVRNMERRWWFSHRYIRYSAGKPQRQSGGWLEYIADTDSSGTRVAVYDSSKDLISGDGTQRMWLAGTNWSIDNFNKFVEKATQFGNRIKTGYAGPGFMTTFENKMRPFVRMQWTTDSFGVKVARYECTHGIINFIVEPEFYGELTDDLVLIDDQFSWYRFMKGRDVQVRKNIQPNDADSFKHELFAEVGPDQKFRNSHSWLTAKG